VSSVTWTSVVDYSDIRYEHSGTGVAKVTIDRQEVRNAFRPETVSQLIDAFARIRDDASVGCVLLTGAGDKAFCAGGDLNAKGHGGYVGGDGLARLNVLDFQRQIRSLPIPVIALVNGFAIGGGTCCMWCATSRSRARTPSSASRPEGRLVRCGLRHRCWRASWATKGQGDRFCAAATRGEALTWAS
jgi:1,4-dihydroxy-2-naphthoyl-CoA synthase